MASRSRFQSQYGPWALVAGAAVGLGAEYARQLGGQGANLVLLDRDEPALGATAEAVRAAHGVEVRAVAVDLARPDVVTAVLPAVRDLEIGLLVYNAAVGMVAPFLELAPADCDEMLDVNCRAPLRLVHALAPPMVARGRGGIVLMSSLSGNVGSAQLAVYAATKAFALVLAEALWAELGPHGIDVLAVQPGSTRTPGWLASQPTGPGAEQMPAMEPADVVREALAALGHEPVVVPGAPNRQAAETLGQLPRRQAIELLSAVTAQLVRKR